MPYILHLLELGCLYTMLALTLNLIVGYSGQLSLTHAAFFGLGAYISTILIVDYDWPFPGALLASILLTAILASLVALPTLHLRGDYLVLATIGFQTILHTLLYNWDSLTRGSFGIGGIPAAKLFGYQIQRPSEHLLLASASLLFLLLVLTLLLKSPFGLLLKAVREDAFAAESLGKRVRHLKLLAFGLGGGLAALPGALYASYAGYIDPTSFTLMVSTFLLATVVIGGAGSLTGPVLGTALLLLLPELLRLVRISDAYAADLRQVLFGLLLIAIVRFRPEGLAGEHNFH